MGLLYKYLDPNRTDVLSNLKIRFSQVKSLNDPFESLPLINMQAELEKQKESINNEFDKLWDELEEHEKTQKTKKGIERKRKESLKFAEDMLSPESMGMKFVENGSYDTGILCLSRTQSNLLMWAHYADSYKGFVIGFDRYHPFLNQRNLKGAEVPPRPVVYSSTRLEMHDGKKDGFVRLYCSKSLDWAYEQEERCFMSFMDLTKATKLDDYDVPIVLYDIPRDAIKEIYIGARTSDKTQKLILEAIKHNGISCKIFKTSFSSTEYKLTFSEIGVGN